MSATSGIGEKYMASEETGPSAPWGLRRRQAATVFRQEIRRNFLGRRALLLYLLALPPIFLVVLLGIVPLPSDDLNHVDSLGAVYAGLYGGLILRTLVFFGCAWTAMNLFRGEMVDRSLHYYFLTPMRREVLVVGKYLSALVATTVVFGACAAASMFVLYFLRVPSESFHYFTSGAGAAQVMAYLGITALACMGYSAVFLIVGLWFRNPIIPALLIYGWEWLNFLLPPFLKKISVIHYIQSLAPVPVSEGPFSVLAEPTPPWLSIPGLFLFTAIVLVAAGLYVRKLEISYGGE